MRLTTPLQLLLPLLCLFPSSLSAGNSQRSPPGKNAILLSQVHSLTLRGGRLTSSRRVSPVPQLNCVGPSKRICNMYELDAMRCTNEGYGYDVEDVQWTCTASLPGEFKLGSTDVVCEGYRNADDPWILKGSCGVEYRLLLTEQGEQKFGHGSFDENSWWRGQKPGKRFNDYNSLLNSLGNLLFWGIFLGVFLWIVFAMLWECFGGERNPPRPGRRWGWGGGGGGDGGPYPGDPPPPYSSSYSYSPMSGQGWRPGFWTGAMTGGGIGYGLGRRNNRYDSPYGRGRRRGYGSGEGSSSSSSRFSAPSTSTGFGSTSRR